MAIRILVMDDEEAIRFALQRYFTHLGCEIDCARDAREAMLLLGRHPHEAVVADLSPANSEDVFDLIGFARGLPSPPRIVVIASTTEGELQDRARRRGADAIVRKPAALSTIAQAVYGLLELKEMADAGAS